jgi:hypothetical protein
MVTPAATAQAQFYKIGDWITFAWNYTSLSVTPSAIDILATCSANQATYTLAVNHSATDSTLLWDTGKYQSTATVPLLTETYTLLVYDADSSISAAPAAGYLGVYNQFTFGMYTRQPYVNWTGKFPDESAQSAYNLLTVPRLHLRKLQPQRLALALRGAHPQDDARHQRHHARLAPLLRLQLRRAMMSDPARQGL